MTGFRAPKPNCGHGGITFTWVPLAALWMCVLCLASIGKLYRVCAMCCRLPPNNTQLVDVHRVGAVCVRCQHDVRGQLRLWRNQ